VEARNTNTHTKRAQERAERETVTQKERGQKREREERGSGIKTDQVPRVIVMEA